MQNKDRLKQKKKRITICIIGVFLAVLTAGVRVKFPIEGHAHTALWHDKTTFIPMPVRIVNGGFELPHIHDITEHLAGENKKNSLSMNYLRAWNVLSVDRGYIQIRKDITEDASQELGKGQYAFLKESQAMFLFQDLATSPGSRLYYGFQHKSGVDGESVLDVYMYPKEESASNAVSQSRANGGWEAFRGRYIVPERQNHTVFGLKPHTDEGFDIALLDNVWAKTGAALLVDKTSDKDNVDYLQVGDIINYTMLIRNYGQIPASRLVIEDLLTGDVEFLGITGTENIDVESARFDETEGKLFFTINRSEYLEGIEEQRRGNIARIQYSVQVKNINHPMLHSQVAIRYNDRGFENMEGNESGFLSYSNVHRLYVQKPLPATSSVAVSLVWRGGTPEKRPSFVGVRLYKNGEVFSDVVELSEENAWSYVWENLEKDILPILSLASGSNASQGEDNGAENRESYVWSVKQTDYLNEYITREERGNENTWIITNTYIGDKSGLDLPQGESETGREYRLPRDGRTGEEKDKPPQEGGEHGDIQKDIPRIGGRDGHIHFENKKEKPAENMREKKKGTLYLEQSISDDIDAVPEGSEVDYTIRIKNTSNQALTGVWIRAYMPKYTHFSETRLPGEYGCIDGKEHVTWFIPHIEGMEETEIGFKVSKDYCVAGKITNEIFYEITDSEEKPYANCAKDPEVSY